jgi:signal transduction histidine kinase
MQLEGHELDGSALQQARLQQHIVSQVSSSPLVLQGDVPGLARLITQEVGRTLGIERVSAWLFNARKDELECVAMYFASRDTYESGAILSQAMFGDEFQALVNSKYVDASDPYTDPRTRGYIEGYLKPNGITSMLDAVVRIGEELIGLVCFEHVNHPHTWEAAEVVFSSQLGDQMALAVSIQRGLYINEQLRLRDAQLLEINEQLEQRVEERTASLHQARNALMESERLAALGAIVAGVAHELNTPIGNARMVATTIADKARVFEQAMNSGTLTKSLLSSFLQEQRSGAILLDNSLERAATLISSFKNVSADQTSGLIRTFKLHAVVQDNLETMSPTVNRHRCKIVFNN